MSGQKLLDLCHSSDLRIVNGRMGDDAGIGSMTFLSANGESLIDYVIMSAELFSIIENFIVHEFYSFSPHAPIQVNIKANMHDRNINVNPLHSSTKIRWDENKVNQYKLKLTSESLSFNEVVENIISENIDFNSGVSDFAHTLYTCSHSISGIPFKVIFFGANS